LGGSDAQCKPQWWRYNRAVLMWKQWASFEYLLARLYRLLSIRCYLFIQTWNGEFHHITTLGCHCPSYNVSLFSLYAKVCIGLFGEA
jgi:hypothetical protein